MDFKKILLYAALAILGFMLWEAWIRDEVESPAVRDTSSTGIVAASSSQSIVNQQQSAGADIVANATMSTNSEQENIPDDRKIIITTDVLQLTIDKKGGDFVESKLLDYAKDINRPEDSFELLNNNRSTIYTARSGLVETGSSLSESQPIRFSSSQNNYQLQSGEDQIIVSLVGTNQQGLSVEKRIIVPRNSYNINVEYNIANKGTNAWHGSVFSELQRRYVDGESSVFYLPTFVGAAISTPDKPFEKIKFNKIAENPIDKYGQGGWAAMVEHYFVSAWIPEEQQLNRFYSYVGTQNLYAIGILSPELVVAPGDNVTSYLNLYTGPELAQRLQAAAPKLDLTIDYGFLWPISKALFWALDNIHDYVNNWGWAIIILTLIIKLFFYHLSAKSYRSMARMRTLQPKILALKERYGDDRQKMGQATIELYKKEKVNPLGGCLPILVQIPVFIALYWVLLESVELRHAPFILWIKDLTVRDPYFVLPVIMGVTMYIQQLLSPAPPDPVQAKVMKLLPVIFTAFFMLFPAGLVLYWTVNNAVSVLQQWYLTRKVEAEAASKNKIN